MTTLNDMYRRTTSSLEFDKMLRSLRNFVKYFGLNHFYYTRILKTGEFTSIGTNLDWHEHSFNHPQMVLSCPLVRDFEAQQSGVIFLKNSSDQSLSSLMDEAYNLFNIHFTICINRKVQNGLESFGFGTHVDNLKAGEHLLKELPLVNKFLDHFLVENKKLITIAHDNQVNLSSQYKKENLVPKKSTLYQERELLLKQLGLGVYETLTERERDILAYVAKGFPAAYVASKLYLSPRTVENYIATIKAKLHCSTKIELLNRARDIYTVLCEQEDTN